MTGPAPIVAGAGVVAAPWTQRIAVRARYYLPAVVVGVVALVLWELVFGVLHIQAFILPPPSAILGELTGVTSKALTTAAWNTLIEAVGGLAVGVVVGAVAGFATARWTGVRTTLLPIAVAANAVPIIAFAPIINNWFGSLDPLSRMVIVAILVFFPVMINVVRGLTQVQPAALELMRSYAASDWQVFRRVRLPNALPFFFTALKISATLSLIGAIVGDYFGGSSDTLGYFIVTSASRLRFDQTWAAIVLGALAGVAFYLVIIAVERFVMPWQPSRDATA